MKIGVDIRVLMDLHYSGVSQYTANLLTAILRRDQDNEYQLFYNSYHDLGKRLAPWQKFNSQLIGCRYPNKIFNYLLQVIAGWPKIDRVLGGVEIFWSPHFNFCRLSPSVKQIVTVHDLSFLRYPEFFSWRKNFWHRALRVKQIMSRATRIVAVSENTKADIIELAGISSDKIDVIYPGNNFRGRPVSEEEAEEFFLRRNLIAQVGETAEFILYLGTIEPRKNIIGLIESYEYLRANDKFGRYRNIKLILAGGKGWKSVSTYRKCQLSKFKDDIIFLGYVTRHEEEILYGRAKAFVYPSFYEGFGFPPLEAMAFGCPVVCSNVSSLPEVVADAALTVNPDKPEEIADALDELFQDNNLRAELVEKGYRQAASFSWDKTAEAYLRLFASLK